MTKKRKKRRKRRADFDTVQQVAGRLVTSGPDYLEKNLGRFIEASAELVEEREFSDLTLDPQRTLEAAARHFDRFRRQLIRAAEKSEEELAEVYDEYRIAALEELDTPQLREDLRQRLGDFITRTQHRGDPDKLEAALFFSMLLDEEQEKSGEPLPLGLCGFMTTIYEDTFDEAMAEVPDAPEIAGEDLTEIWRIRHEEQDLAALAEVTKKSKTMDDLGRRIKADPELALAWQRQQPHLLRTLVFELDDLSADLITGHFTAEEIDRAMDRMEQANLSRPWHLSRYIGSLALIRWFQTIQEVLAEIVTPERQAEIASTFRTAGQQMLKSDDPENQTLALHLLAASESVANADWPAGNKVLIALFEIAFDERIEETESLSRQWQRMLDRVENSLLVKQFREDS